jgi:hypothetical protein
MLPILPRALGTFILALGFVVLNYDVSKTLELRGLHVTKIGDAWSALHSTSLQLLQPAIERHVAIWVWDPVVLTILIAPTWLVLGILGSIFMLIGRKKKPLIGYGRH